MIFLGCRKVAPSINVFYLALSWPSSFVPALTCHRIARAEPEMFPNWHEWSRGGLHELWSSGGREGGPGQIIQEPQTMDNNKQETRATCQGEAGLTQITQITNITWVPLPALLLWSPGQASSCTQQTFWHRWLWSYAALLMLMISRKSHEMNSLRKEQQWFV